jgi:hypothetical protein
VLETETTMVVLGVLLNIVGLAVLLWLMFALAVHALPFFVGVTLALAAYESGAGAIAAGLVGLAAGVTTLGIAQIAFASVHSEPVRGAIALLFSAPAAVAGYHAVLGLARIGGLGVGWQEAFAIVGAIMVGGAAWARLGDCAEPAAGQGGAADPVQSR